MGVASKTRKRRVSPKSDRGARQHAHLSHAPGKDRIALNGRWWCGPRHRTRPFFAQLWEYGSMPPGWPLVSCRRYPSRRNTAEAFRQDCPARGPANAASGVVLVWCWDHISALLLRDGSSRVCPMHRASSRPDGGSSQPAHKLTKRSQHSSAAAMINYRDL